MAHDELPELLASAGRQLVKRYSGSASEVEDLKQAVAVELLGRFGSSLNAFNGDLIALIMRRRYIDLVRSRLRRRLRDEAYVAVSQLADSPSYERLSDLLSALEELSVEERELLLRERGGPLKAAERQRLHRLRISLRERLK